MSLSVVTDARAPQPLPTWFGRWPALTADTTVTAPAPAQPEPKPELPGFIQKPAATKRDK